MRVTFCIHDRPNYVAGPASWLTRLLPALHKRGVEIQVLGLVNKGGGTATAALQAAGLNYQEYCEGYTEDKTRWLLDRLAENPPDVFVPNCYVPAFYAARWAWEAGIPTIGVMHSDDAFYRAAVNQFVFDKTQYRLSAWVCVSRFLEEQVLARTPEDTIIYRQPYGTPVPSVTVSPPASYLRLVYSGRFAEEQKRISEVARAMCRAVREVPGTEAILYGSGSEQPALEKILAEEGAGLPISIGGRIDSARMPETLSHAHVLVLLSDYEGLPVALMEAMGAGVVPICTRIRSGIPELVEDGVTGLLVDDRGDAFVAAVRRLREEPGLWERMSQAAQRKILEQYTSEVCADRWEVMLRELVASAPERKPLSIPARLKLPAVAAGYPEWSDVRRPTASARLLGRARVKLGRIRRSVFKGS